MIAMSSLLAAVLLPYFAGGLPTQDSYATKSIDRGAYRIAYHDMGKGRPFVAIPGGPGFSGRTLWSFGYEMKEIGRTILFDQLGTGDSQLNAGTSDLKSHLSLLNTLADLEALRKSLGFKKWSVFGQSWGAIVAVSYAAHYPESVDRLVLASVPGFGMNEQMPLRNSLEKLIPPIVQDELLKLELDPSIDELTKLQQQVFRVLPYYFANFEEGKALAARAPEGLFSPRVFQILYPNVPKFETYENLAKKLTRWTGKALVIQGHLDPVGGAMGYELKYRFLPRAEVVMLTGAGHFSWMERRSCPEFFWNLYRWLGCRPKRHWEITDIDDQSEVLAHRKRLALGWPFGYVPK